MRWPLALYRIQGHSMRPTYQPGDTVLGWRGWRPGLLRRHIRPGRVVVAQVGGRLVIKRAAALHPAAGPHAAGSLTLAGDNPADSQDSRHYGAVPLAAVEAVIVLRLP